MREVTLFVNSCHLNDHTILVYTEFKDRTTFYRKINSTAKEVFGVIVSSFAYLNGCIDIRSADFPDTQRRQNFKELTTANFSAFKLKKRA